jgi:hypothetical protein
LNPAELNSSIRPTTFLLLPHWTGGQQHEAVIHSRAISRFFHLPNAAAAADDNDTATAAAMSIAMIYSWEHLFTCPSVHVRAEGRAILLT